ncbi:hypothetical protein AGMMS49940_21370 [Spirochaetia bacterium]|nr:hypothetical protein AGMMS49940_21370 [Spirochaetia bacterium]
MAILEEFEMMFEEFDADLRGKLVHGKVMNNPGGGKLESNEKRTVRGSGARTKMSPYGGKSFDDGKDPRRKNKDGEFRSHLET